MANDTVTVSREVLEATLAASAQALQTTSLALQALLGERAANAELAAEVGKLTDALKTQGEIGAKVGAMLKRVQQATPGRQEAS